MKSTVTAKDLAKACNVSQATVSYVINNKEGKNISEETRNLILETAKALHYFPNASAQNVRKKSCCSIGLVCGNNYTNLGFSNALMGIKKYLESQGYSLILLNDDDDPENNEYVKSYYSNIIEGIIFISFDAQTFRLRFLQEHNIPYVIISENGVWSYGMKKKKAFENVVNECIRFCRDNKLKKIRYFTVEVKGKLYQNKYVLVKRAIDTIYPESDFERIICKVKARTSEELTPIIDDYISKNNFDIAISPNQKLGLILQNAILKDNFIVPQKTKHICLVSAPYFQTIYPSITSIDIQLTEMGAYAAELLLSIINGSKIEEKDFECNLIHGLSTKI